MKWGGIIQIKKFLRYKKKILYTEYIPKSQLVVPSTEITHSKFPVIDAHTHFGCHVLTEKFEDRYDANQVIEQLKAVGVKHCIDLTLYNRNNWDRIHKKLKNQLDFFDFCAPIDFSHFQDKNFHEWVISEMEEYVREGAVGFKVWKDLGFKIRYSNGLLVKLSDNSLKFIWDKASELDVPIVIHIADPPAFFEKADAKNERLEQITKYYFWHHYSKGFHFSPFMEQLEQLLFQNPKTKFLVAHFCSYPSNLLFVSQLMQKYDNLYTDCAAVLSELGRQPKQFRETMMYFKDRILFGTDYFSGEVLPYLPYFRFFETDDEYFSYSEDGNLENGRWNIYGCNLTDDLLRKLYFENAQSFFNLT